MRSMRGPQGQGRRRLTIIGNTTASVVSPPRITRLPTALQPPHSRLNFTPRRRPCVDYPGICRPACPPLSVPPARHPPPARPRRYPRRGDRPTNRDVWQCLCAAGDRGLMAWRRPQATVAAAWRPRAAAALQPLHGPLARHRALCQQHRRWHSSPARATAWAAMTLRWRGAACLTTVPDFGTPPVRCAMGSLVAVVAPMTTTEVAAVTSAAARSATRPVRATTFVEPNTPTSAAASRSRSRS